MPELTSGGGEQPPERSQNTMQIWLVPVLFFIALPAVVVLVIKYFFGF